MSKEIGELIQSREICAKFRPQNTREILNPYVVPSDPFKKIGMDFAKLQHKQYLVVADCFSKWIEVFPSRTGKITEVIENLIKLFAQFGIPETVVANNVPFNSTEF